eukprot:GHVU01099542.1.p2 GENE.GHVU01099542.1~~GHVU01099542.1.p2  ORF type:complete len:141 (+),score=6.59 GHVU01099542.1:370-792(+)
MRDGSIFSVLTAVGAVVVSFSVQLISAHPHSSLFPLLPLVFLLVLLARLVLLLLLLLLFPLLFPLLLLLVLMLLFILIAAFSAVSLASLPQTLFAWVPLSAPAVGIGHLQWIFITISIQFHQFMYCVHVLRSYVCAWYVT